MRWDTDWPQTAVSPNGGTVVWVRIYLPDDHVVCIPLFFFAINMRWAPLHTMAEGDVLACGLLQAKPGSLRIGAQGGANYNRRKFAFAKAHFARQEEEQQQQQQQQQGAGPAPIAVSELEELGSSDEDEDEEEGQQDEEDEEDEEDEDEQALLAAITLTEGGWEGGGGGMMVEEEEGGDLAALLLGASHGTDGQLFAAVWL